MSSEEMLLDPWNVTAGERAESTDDRRPGADRDAPRPETGRGARAIHGVEAIREARASSEPGGAPREHGPERGHAAGEPQVPPVRTIVLDRPPVPVAPPVRERNPLRAPPPSTARPERLQLSDLSIAYAGKPAVKSVSLSIHQGEVLALIGPAGCGKTTLLRTLNRLTELTPSAARQGQGRSAAG